MGVPRANSPPGAVGAARVVADPQLDGAVALGQLQIEAGFVVEVALEPFVDPLAAGLGEHGGAVTLGAGAVGGVLGLGFLAALMAQGGNSDEQGEEAEDDGYRPSVRVEKVPGGPEIIRDKLFELTHVRAGVFRLYMEEGWGTALPGQAGSRVHTAWG